MALDALAPNHRPRAPLTVQLCVPHGLHPTRRAIAPSPPNCALLLLSPSSFSGGQKRQIHLDRHGSGVPRVWLAVWDNGEETAKINKRCFFFAFAKLWRIVPVLWLRGNPAAQVGGGDSCCLCDVCKVPTRILVPNYIIKGKRGRWIQCSSSDPQEKEDS